MFYQQNLEVNSDGFMTIMQEIERPNSEDQGSRRDTRVRSFSGGLFFLSRPIAVVTGAYLQHINKY